MRYSSMDACRRSNIRGSDHMKGLLDAAYYMAQATYPWSLAHGDVSVEPVGEGEEISGVDLLLPGLAAVRRRRLQGAGGDRSRQRSRGDVQNTIIS
jgi:hypothetical protein